MERSRRHLTVLRQCPYRVTGNVRSRNNDIQHKDEGLTLLFNGLDDRSYCPEVMRAGPDGDNDQISHGKGPVRFLREGRRGVDNDELDAVLVQGLKAGGILPGVYRCEKRRRRFPGIPPIGQGALWVRVNDVNRTTTLPLGLDGQMVSEGAFASSAFG